jgi:hypothetical protein
MHPKHKKSIFRIIIPILIGGLIGVSYIAYPKFTGYMHRMELEKQNKEILEQIKNGNVAEKTAENIEKDIPEDSKTEENTDTIEKEVVILENAYLEVPFVCQAPFQTEANWVYHEESCEEAALLQVHYYYEGVTQVDKQTAHNIIMDMISWQEKKFKAHIDLYAKDMKTFITEYYDYPEDRVQIIEDAEILDIKKAISQGYPVIVPIMGDLLKNPYYPYPGYHMLTVIGYSDTHIITNDVGTRRGKDFTYLYERFKKAMDGAGGDIIIITKI